MAGLPALLVGRVFVAPAEVVVNRAGEKHVVLQHDGNRVAQALHVVSAHIHAADAHLARRYVIQAGNQVDQTRLGRTCAAHDADGLAGLDVQIDIAKHRLAAALLIGERHMVKVDGTILHGLDRVFRAGDIRLLLQHFLNALRRRGGLRHHDEDHGEHHQAHQDVHDIGKQAGQLARGQAGLADDHLRAEPADDQNAGVHGQLHDRHGEGDDALGGDGVFEQIVRRAGELFILIFFADKRLDHADRADVFLDHTVDRVVFAEHLTEIPHRLRDEDDDHHAQKRDRTQKHGGKLRADGKRHEQRDNQRHRRAGADLQNHLKRILDVGDVGGQARDKARGGEPVDIGKGIILNASEHRLAQIGGQTRARPRAVDARANAEDHRQNRHHGHQRTDLRDVRHVAHGNALVDDGCGQIRNQNFKHDAQRRIHRRKQRVFFVLPDLLRNARAGDMLLFAGLFFFSHSNPPFLLFLFLCGLLLCSHPA